MNRVSLFVVAATLVAALVTVSCASTTSPATPTQAPAAPQKAAEPTKAPASTTAPAAAPTAAKAAAPAATAAPAKKVDFPAQGRPITIVAPAAPGGTVDLSARMLAPELQKELGVPVNVVNKPGAGTLIGAYEVVQAKPDGYTLGIESLSSVTQGYLDPAKQVPINGRQDFKLIGMTSIDPSIVVVLSSSPYKTGKDLVDAAKANPGKVIVGTTGLLSPNHLVMTAVEQAGGVQFAFVHFDGAGPASTALLGGHVNAAAFIIGGSSAAQVASGTMRILGISGTKRSRFYPEIKTWQEQGYDATYANAYAIAGPAGTPKEIVDILANALKKVVESDTIQTAAAKSTMSLQYMAPAQADAYWEQFESQVKTLADLAKKPR